MDFLKFLKKHYEKVLLSVLLTALAVATIILLFRVSTERRQLNVLRQMDVIEGTKALPTIDLSTNDVLLRRLRRPAEFELDGGHNLFNPVTWMKRPDGNLLKIVTGNEVGAGALQITDVAPLYLRASYEGSVVRGSDVSHRFKITREAHRNPRKRSAITLEVIGAGAKNDVFILRQMRPTVDEPELFVLEMIDERKIINVTKEEPYEGIAGYTVDLQYVPDKQVFLKKRLEDKLVFAGDTNRIVAIEESSVTVEAVSNRKRTTITKSAPEDVSESP